MKNRDRKDIIQDTKGSQMKETGLGQVNIQQLCLTVKWGAAVCGLFHLEGLVLQFSSSALCGESMQVIQQGFFLHSAFILRGTQLLCQLRYTATLYHTTCSCHIFSYMTKTVKFWTQISGNILLVDKFWEWKKKKHVANGWKTLIWLEL